MDYLNGHLLVADPRLADSNFYHSLVLITRHSDEGASGLIMNHPSNIELQDVWDQLSESPLGRNAPVFVGGPVQGPLAALHDKPELADFQVLPDLFYSMNRRQLDALLVRSDGNVRIFSGYSGWGPGQLEQELELGGWMTMPARSEHVFAEPDSVYKTVCEELGYRILFAGEPPGTISSDPSRN